MGTDLLTQQRRSNGWTGCVGEALTASSDFSDQSTTSAVFLDYAAVIPVRPRTIAVTQPASHATTNAVAASDLPHRETSSSVQTQTAEATEREPAKWWQLENL